MDLVDGGVGGVVSQRLTKALRGELSRALGRRLIRPSQVAVALGQPEIVEQARCLTEAYVDCAVAVGRAVRADYVIAGTVAALGDAEIVDLRLIDIRARAELNRLQSPLSGDAQEQRRMLRELGVRLAAPEAYVGSLQINSIAIGDEVVIDGEAVVAGSPATQVSLPVGQHALEVVRGGKTALTQIIDVRFEETFVVVLPLAVANGVDDGASGGVEATGDGEVTPAAGWPVWPAYVALGVGAASLAGAAVALIDLLVVVDPTLAEAQNNYQDKGVVCPATEEKPEPNKDCFVQQIEDYKQARAGDIAFISVFSGVVIIAAAAAVVVFLNTGGEETEDGTPAPAGGAW